MIYFDTETAGLLPTHPTIQLAACARDGGVELGSFNQCIAFDIGAADPDALAMNSFDAARWAAEAVAPGVVAARFAAWLRPYCTVPRVSKAGNRYTVTVLAAYNANFDTPRLEALFGAAFCPWDRRVRDVLQRVLFYADEHGLVLENYKLATVAAHFGLATDGAHDALADARMAARVYERIVALQRTEAYDGD